jgi:hypothetical protein
MFVIFDIALIDEEDNSRIWLDKDTISSLKLEEYLIYNIYEFPIWTINIDFNYPQLMQNSLVAITEGIENLCPVANQLGKSGCGEGAVWKCTTPGYEDSQFWMKVKGEKHSASKVKTIASVDIESIESIQNFVEATVTPQRCIQSLQKLNEAGRSLDRSVLGDYIRWISNDIIKEESDTIVANQLDVKKLGSYISNKARDWFFENELNFQNIV